ncbi:hypothetical protein LY90DRAFT_676576 [Neocallimastix californiae]|jgi:hypothetical protein|uniref:Uncharacterized protein n=1 Tax=Neocallimastix californiae TaxID=1754190 RepID=A0A1Y2AE90_9FUNG|nr:hypothetical protein LY90DRAFT_676576 [Neocallimastix californiae]|eukprot:ORY20816.1 hypothetical protein LY90DRAFT_676576 [Neocallimastix californiae]
MLTSRNIDALDNYSENLVSNETVQVETNTNEIFQTDINVYNENEQATTLIKLSNFTKLINYKDLTFTFNQFKLTTQGIHIPICYDNQSKLFQIGHCYNLVFIEFINEKEARNAFNDKILRNKLRFFFGDDLYIQYASKNELIQLLFPTYFCKFSDLLQQNIDYESLIPDNENIFFIDFSEMEILTNICQKPDVYSNFKSEERPFNFVISLCKHYPWNKSNKNYNNKVFNFYKNIIMILNQHIEEKKFTNRLTKALLSKMVKVGVECPGFTNTQKRSIIKKFDNIDNYKEMIVKKDSSESKKKGFESNALENSTNTTTTPVNTTDDTTNNSINDDSSNKTVDGDEQYEDENKIEEGSPNQENGLTNSESSKNGESNNAKNKLTPGTENGQNDQNKKLMDYINKNVFPNYGYAIQPIPPPIGKYYGIYGNYDYNNYYQYGNYDYNNYYDSNGNYLAGEKLENNMKGDKKYQSNSNRNTNNNKYNQRSSLYNKGNNHDNNDYNSNNNSKYKHNEKGGRPKVKNYPDIPIQLARSMVNKTPDCNELFKEYCGILDSWYNQKLSKEIDMRVEQKLNEINYDRIKCDKIIKLLENLHVEPLFDINEDMETKLFKLVAEILRLQGVERSFSEYKSNSIDSFKSQINRLTENISNIYQIINVEKSQKELINLSNQLSILSQFSKFNTKVTTNHESNGDSFQELILNAFNHNGNNNTNNNNNLRKSKPETKRENSFIFNNNSNNNNDRERKGRNNISMNNYNTNGFSYNNENNKKFSLSNNLIVNAGKGSITKDNSNEFHRPNKSIKTTKEELSYNNNFHSNQNQNNNFYSMKVNKSINIGANTQDKINSKTNRKIISNKSDNPKLNIINGDSKLLNSSNDTLNNENIPDSNNDNPALNNCESMESCATTEIYISNQDDNLKKNNESVSEKSKNDLDINTKGVILNKPEIQEIKNAD